MRWLWCIRKVMFRKRLNRLKTKVHAVRAYQYAYNGNILTKSSMKHASLSVLLFALFHISGLTHDSKTLPDTISRFDGKYVLSGCRLRELLFSDIYFLGLYLPNPETDSADIAGSGRVFLLKMLHEG